MKHIRKHSLLTLLSPTGTEVVQYQQPSSFENTLPSTIFSEEDENLLLTSLDEDAKCLVTSDQLNEDESAAT